MFVDFYTSVLPFGDNILVSGYKDGRYTQQKVPYEPYLFIPAQSGEYQSIDGIPLMKYQFDSLKDAKKYIDRYTDVAGFKYYGMEKFQYPFIYDNFPGVIDFDYSLLHVTSLDIEVDCIDGFSSPHQADNEVTLITLARNGKRITFGCQPYNPKDDNVKYVLCRHEKDLLRRFLAVWNEDEHFRPDIVTGWNIEKYDIPYLVNRIIKVLGDDEVKKLSPWGFIKSRSFESAFGQTETVYDLYGITVIDYLSAYRKFAYTQQESYTLDHVCSEELGVSKVDYGEYGSLGRLQAGNWELYVDYNIRDADLIEWLDQKRQLIKLIVTMAYDAKANFIDTFTTVGLWDVLIHNYLMERKIAIPQKAVGDVHRTSIIGGYVKDPQVGLHNWVMSFDINSLYPHVIIQYNISPETYLGEFEYKQSANVEDNINFMFKGGLRDQECRKHLLDNNCTLTANMLTFERKRQGFLPALMSRMYDDRTEFKKLMKQAKKEVEPIEKEMRRRGLL